MQTAALLVVIGGLLIGLLCIALIDWWRVRPYPSGYPLQIAHGAGVYNGRETPNHLMAMQENYLNGFRCFEIDIVIQDGQLHWAHDKDVTNGSTEASLCMPPLFEWMHDKPLKLILDVKGNFNTAFDAFVAISPRHVDKQIICQVGHSDNIEHISQSKASFSEALIANWKHTPSEEGIFKMLDTARRHDIQIVATSIWSPYMLAFGISKWYYGFYAKLGIPIHVHGGIDRADRVEFMMNNGYGVFSDTRYVTNLMVKSV